MKKRIALLWAVIIAALLAGTGLGLPWLVRWMNGGQLFSADTMLSLYVAVYTLEATLVIAVLIYSLQTGAADREARRRARSARRILYTELSQGLDALVRFSGGGNCGLLSELFLTYLPDIQGLFTPQQLHHLIQVIDALVGVSRLSVTDEEEAAGHAGGSLLLVIQPQYYSAMRGPFSYRFSSLSDYRTALNPITREILEILSGQPLPEAGGTVLRTTTGQPLLDTSGYPRVRMYDEDGGLLCDASWTATARTCGAWSPAGPGCGITKVPFRTGSGTGLGAATPPFTTTSFLPAPGSGEILWRAYSTTV